MWRCCFSQDSPINPPTLQLTVSTGGTLSTLAGVNGLDVTVSGSCTVASIGAAGHGAAGACIGLELNFVDVTSSCPNLSSACFFWCIW